MRSHTTEASAAGEPRLPVSLAADCRWYQHNHHSQRERVSLLLYYTVVFQHMGGEGVRFFETSNLWEDFGLCIYIMICVFMFLIYLEGAENVIDYADQQMLASSGNGLV